MIVNRSLAQKNARGLQNRLKSLFEGSFVTQQRCTSSLTVLGIESSCDDSCVGVINYESRSILADERISQFSTHQQYGGIVPTLAVREHEANLPVVYKSALEKIKDVKLDLIAVTTGPGLKACLRAGMNLALQVHKERNIPLISINHLEAHTLVPRLDNPNIEFPFMSLLVSGGHTCLSIAHGPGNHTELGSTLDDAIGETYDKVIRTLMGGDSGSRHGGAILEELAAKGNLDCGFRLPLPLRRSKHRPPYPLDFSFSGLKSATAREIEKKQYRAEDVAAVFQQRTIDHLIDVLQLAFQAYPEINRLVVSGGVASNKLLRSRLTLACEGAGIQLYFPPARLCVDNGVMVAWCGAERWVHSEQDPTLRRRLLMSEATTPQARWPLGDLHGT